MTVKGIINQNGHTTVCELYRTFQIVFMRQGAGYSDYYTIYRDNERYTCMALISIQACKNIIDTFFKQH